MAAGLLDCYIEISFSAGFPKENQQFLGLAGSAAGPSAERDRPNFGILLGKLSW
jgi:hypothetical protein